MFVDDNPVVTDDEIKKRADEAEAGYDVEELKRRGRGRPGRGAEPMQVVAVRLTVEELAALDASATQHNMSRSEVIRAALAHFVARPAKSVGPRTEDDVRGRSARQSPVGLPPNHWAGLPLPLRLTARGTALHSQVHEDAVQPIAHRRRLPRVSWKLRWRSPA
jgi:hypothetical protein